MLDCWRLPQVYDRNAYTLSEQYPLILYRIGEEGEEGEDILRELVIILSCVILLSIVQCHGSLSQSPLLAHYSDIGGVGGSLDN